MNFWITFQLPKKYPNEMKDGTDEGLPSAVDISGLFQIMESAGTDESKTNSVF